MEQDYGLLRRVVVLLICASLVAYPCRIHARPFVEIEVTDTEDFAAGMKKFIGGAGFDGSQMQEFLRAPKKEWSAILDRFADQFGFSPRLISTLLSGRVVVRIAKEAFLIGSIQKDAGSVVSMIAEIRKLIESAADIKSRIEEGQDAVRITLSVPGNVIMIGAKDNRFVITGGQDQGAAEKLCDQFIVSVVGNITERDDICPELRGGGVIMMQDASAMIEKDVVVDGRPSNAAKPWISGPFFSRMYFQDNDLWVVGFLPGRKSLVGPLYVEGSVSEPSLAWLPAECESAAAFHFNLAGLIPMLLEKEGVTDEQSGPGGIAQSLEMVKRTFAFDLQAELFVHIGDEIVFGQLPVGKGGGFPVFSAIGLGSTYGVIRLRNPMAFKEGLDKLLIILGGMAARDTVGGGLKRTVVEGQMVRYLRVACGLLSPCFALKDGYLVLTNNIPTMRFLLANHGSWKTLTQDGDFQSNLALLSENPTSGFSYKRYRHRDDGGGAATAALTGVAITGMLAGMLLPALGKAKEEAKKATCRSNLRQIGLGCKMYAMDHDDKWPQKLSDLHGEYTKDLRLFACPSRGVSMTKLEEIDNRSPYVLIAAGADDADVAGRVAIYEKKGLHKGGSNVLFGDGHVEWVNNLKLLGLLPAPPKIYPFYIGGPKAGVPAVLTADTFNMFLTREARNLAVSVDFAIFPAVEDFSGEGSSNISIVEVRKEGIFSKMKIGHISGGAGGSIVGIALIAIVAAIMIPNFMRTRPRPVAR